MANLLPQFIFTDLAKSLLRKHEREHQHQPFYLHMSYQQAHAPLEVDETFRKRVLETCKKSGNCGDMSEERITHMGK